LDVIWYEVKDVRALANLFAPVKASGPEDDLHYVRRILCVLNLS